MKWPNPLPYSAQDHKHSGAINILELLSGHTWTFYFLPCSLLQQGSQLPSLEFGRDSKAGRKATKLHSEQEEGFRCALIGDSRHGEAAGGLNRREAYLAFSDWSRVGIGDKK